MSARHEAPEADDQTRHPDAYRNRDTTDEAPTGLTERTPAADPWAYDPMDRYSSRVVVGHEHEAGIPALFAAALAPVESAESIPAFASGALSQIAAELTVLDYVRREGDLNEEIVNVFAYGIEERARVAAEVVIRMADARRPQKGSK